MLVLFETPAGYAIFKVLDDEKVAETDNLYRDFETPERASQIVKLKHFEKFADTTEALAATTAAVEGKLCKTLKKTLTKYCSDVQDQLAVADTKLGNAIKEKLSLSCVHNSAVHELMRCIRSQLDSLLAGFPKKEMTAMALGLAHSLSRYKLKFSPDKIDTMIIQAVCLLDDLDKELNNYVMRCREWYGWHFPELGKLITDNVAFVKTVKIIGTRENTSASDLSDILPEEVEERVKEAAEISMGTEISEDDIINIQHLCDQVLEISLYRVQLYDYLKARMMAMAPNLTVLVGDLVGARLISSAGSLINLAKHPASTLQILGAEKALFRALKTKRDTPKYGLIYHSSLISQASTKNKGKAARMLAAKASLATRVDALGEDTSFELGTEHRAKLEMRLRFLEEGNLRRISGTGKAQAKFEKYHAKSEVVQYPVAADSTLTSKKRTFSETEDKKPLIEEIMVDSNVTEEEPKKKKKKEKKGDVEVIETPDVVDDESGKKKKKKKAKQEPEEIMESSEVQAELQEKPKKKKPKQEPQEDTACVDPELSPKKESKKKKKMKQEPEESVEIAEAEEAPPKEPKKKKLKVEVKDEPEESVEATTSEKKKKKKKKSQSNEEDI